MSSIARPVARSVSRSVLAGQGVDLGYLIRSMFAGGEQGFTRTPYDLSAMFQDAAGTIPVTGVGQPVGLILDKSKGLLVSSELIADTSFDNPSYWSANNASVAVTGGNAVFTNSTTGNAFSKEGLTLLNKWYKVKIVVSSITSGALRVSVSIGAGEMPSPNITSAGVYTLTLLSSAAVQRVQVTAIGTVNAVVSELSVKEISGNHAYQTTSSMRPLLVASPQRLDFDTVDDKLITNLPAQLTGCTVIRSVPNVGTQILTNQTIPATYEDNKDHCGLIVINRALTPSETSTIAAEFNKRAGV